MRKMITILVLLIGFNAHAGLIEIELSDGRVDVGERVEVRLIATDLDDFDAFGFNLHFDTSVLTLDLSTLDSDLFSSLTLFGVFEAIQLADGIAFGFSDFSPVSLGSFLLASFDLVAISEGRTSLSLANIAVNEPFPSSNTLNVDSGAPSTVTVPEPSTTLLLLFGGIVIFFRKARQNKTLLS